MFRRKLPILNWIDLEPIKKLLSLTTPGPWDVDYHSHMMIGCRCGSCEEDSIGWLLSTPSENDCESIVAEREQLNPSKRMVSCEQVGLLKYEDAKFAAEARELVPELIAEIERLRQINGSLRRSS